MSFLRALTRHFLYSAAAHRFEIDRCGQCNQTFVRTNVGRGFLAPNVLFAGGQRQNKTAPALFVVSFANQTAGNLPRVLIARRKQPYVRSPE